MGWQDRRYDDSNSGQGRFSRALRRIFGEGDNPLQWAVPLYTAWGIRVRVHILFIIFSLVGLISSIDPNGLGLVYAAFGMVCLFVLVLLHEYGHCLACRWVGGEADDILMWPLGGLASCRPPPGWRAELVTTIGGPAVNVVLVPVLALPLVAVTRDIACVAFNPFDWRSGFLAAVLPSTGQQPMWLAFLWWAYMSNLALLLFNVLVPMYPMDGGRMVRALLWWRLGRSRASRIAATMGLVGAMALAVVGVVTENNTLIGVALFGGVTCWFELRTLKFIDDGGEEESRYAQALASQRAEQDRDRAVQRRARKAREEAAHQQEVDRILSKIATTGMASLTEKEKRTLRRDTDLKRKGA